MTRTLGRPRAAHPLCAAVLALTGLFPTVLARADDTHYQDYPIGGRAVGFGGAFTALSDDGSGVFYNPAGIVDSNRLSLSISSTLYGLEIADTLLSAVGQAADLNRIFTDLNIIPTSGSAVSAIGDLDEQGRPRRAYGLGAFVPSYRSVNTRNSATIPDVDGLRGCERLTYSRTLLDRTFHFGASYAERIDDTWRLGVSGFLTYRALRDSEESSCSTPEEASSLREGFATAQTDLSLGVASVLFSVGMKADLGMNWTAGLTVTTPSIRVFDTASLEVTRTSVDPASGQSFYDVRRLDDIHADVKTGATVRAGLAFVEPDRLTIAADLSFHAPTHYRLFDDELEGENVRNAVTLVSDIRRRFTTNASIGLEYLLAKSFSIAGGLFTNLSSAPKIPGERGARFEESQLPHVDASGGSFVLGFFSEHVLTRVGFTASYGTGSDVVPQFAGLGALGAETEWVKVDLSRTFIFFFIGSTFRY